MSHQRRRKCILRKGLALAALSLSAAAASQLAFAFVSHFFMKLGASIPWP